METENEASIWETVIFKFDQYTFTIYNVAKILLVLVVAVGIYLLVSQVILRTLRKRGSMDLGRTRSLTSLTKYFVVVIAAIAILSAAGVNITLLIASSTALFVGIGFGLQTTFNDLVSGVILLFEGSIEVGHVVQVDERVARVIHIGLRSSRVLTRDNVVLIIPNSHFITDDVINWTHNNEEVRFMVEVGVAYGSDVRKVEKLLIESALSHEAVLKKPEPRVMFYNFADSALVFRLFFFSDSIFPIEFVKSDIRFVIDQKFREANVNIPFPQRSLHIGSHTFAETPITLKNEEKKP